MRHYTVADALNLLTNIVAGASAVRIGLHWLRGFLENWIEPQSPFWHWYGKVETSAAYVSISLAAFGKKKPESTPDAPVTKMASPAEGQIKP